MNRDRWTARRLHIESEEGVGLVLVILIILALSVMTTAALGAAQVTQRQSRNDQDAQAALAAAEAGVDDYLYRLGRDDTYWRYRTDAGAAGRDPNNPAMGEFSPADRDAGWARLAGSESEAGYHYDPVGTTVGQDGSIVLQSTGWVRDQTRTLEVTIRKRSVLEYLYFTRYETLDPNAYPDDASRNWANANCRRYRYPPDTRPAGCVEIQFITGDVIQGKFHTNDSFLVSGSPTWQRQATSSWRDPAGRHWVPNGAAHPSFPPGSPTYADPIELPQFNTQIKVEADRLQGGQGCLYTGPTEITLNDDGSMTVVSPYTDPSTVNAGCLVGANPPGADPPPQHRVPLPRNGVVYVQSAPADRCDVPVPAGRPEGNRLGYPVADDSTAYNCTAGDVFLSGTYRGQLTIAADNNIVIVDDVQARDRTGTDLLGLVANNYVEVYHPVRCTNPRCTTAVNVIPTSGGRADDVTIDAAILSMQHSFRVQNHALGAQQGLLHIYGSIAQYFRGPVGASGAGGRHGYTKDYVYDDRLTYLSPPHFIDPVEAPWVVQSYAEVRSRY